MSITSIMCVKCGGCPAYRDLLTCLFCEDGAPCPCGGWKTIVAAAKAQTPRPRKYQRKTKKIGSASLPIERRELSGGGPRSSNQPNSLALSASVERSTPPVVSALEVRPVRFDGDFLERRLRQFYGAR